MNSITSNQLNEAADILSKATAEIETIISHPSLINVRARVLGDILKSKNLLSAMAKGEAGAEQPTEPGQPVRFMLGKAIKSATTFSPQDFASDEIKQEAAKDHEGEELNATVQKLYPEFSNMESDVILDSLSDLEIRGIAKKSGLPVTENFPKKLDTQFIDQIKEAIAKRALLEDITKGAIQGDENDNNDNGLSGNAGDETGGLKQELSLEELLVEKSKLEEAIEEGEQSKIHHTKIKSLKNKLNALNENIEKLSEPSA